MVPVGELAETRVRPGRGALLSVAAARLDPLFVDVDRPGVDAHRVGPLVEHLHAPLEESRGADVVVGRPAEQLTAGELESEVRVVDAADVPRIPEVPDPGVLLCVRLADAGGPVGRSVVADHELEILQSLREDRIDRLPQIPFAVVNGKADAHAGNLT